VRLYGFEAGGDGVDTGRHAASLTGGSPGVLHGARTFVLQDDDGQTRESHSISAGLDYPAVGPEHAWLHETGRADYQPVTDAEAMDAFALLCRTEGIIPAIESAHALAGALRVAPELAGRSDRRPTVVVTLSGRGDKDMETAGRWFGLLDAMATVRRVSARDVPRRRSRERARRRRGGRPPWWATCRPGSPACPAASRRSGRWSSAGVDLVEVGLPYSDPVMDGPVIQRATGAALAAGTRTADVLRTVEAVAGAGAPVVVMTYWNPVERYGVDRFARDLAAAGGAGLITPDLIPDEAGDWLAAADAHDLDRIFLVSPSSTDQRLAMTVAHCRGLRLRHRGDGVTGAREQTSTAAPDWWRGSGPPAPPCRSGSGWGCATARRRPRSRRTPTG
jgi:hypothetical protein